MLRVGFIGAGKTGVALGKYLGLNGQTLSGYLSKNFKYAKEAAVFTDSKTYESLASFLADTDLVFITTPDDQIKGVWQALKKHSLTGKLVAHTSGSLASEIFEGIEAMGGYGYSLHPFMAINDKYTGHKRLKVATFTLEGHPDKLALMKGLLPPHQKLNIIDGKNKALYHASAVFASNFTVALAHISDSMLKHIGIHDTDTVLNIMENTIVNLKTSGIVKGLTGPVERGDSETIARHMAHLSGQELAIYAAMSKDLLTIAQEKNTQRDYHAVKKLLE